MLAVNTTAGTRTRVYVRKRVSRSTMDRFRKIEEGSTLLFERDNEHERNFYIRIFKRIIRNNSSNRVSRRSGVDGAATFVGTMEKSAVRNGITWKLVGYIERDIGRSWSIQWVHLVELLEGSSGKGEGIVPVHRRVPATNRGCIIHSLGYTRTGIALRPLCVCVVSEQYRHAKVARPRRMRFTSKLPRLQPGYRGACTPPVDPSRTRAVDLVSSS